MNKIFTYVLSAGLIISGMSVGMAQTNESANTNKIKSESDEAGLNMVKLNVTALPLSNFSFQYERPLTNRISAAIGMRLMPKGGLPLKSAIEDLIDDEEAWQHFEKLEIGNFAITPEVRFYTGKKSLQGFYIAPFARIASYTAAMPYNFEYEHPVDGPQEEIIPLDGKISTFTGGFMLGAQWKLSKLVYLDWWILGPHYGTSKGDISGKMTLSQEEQDGLRDGLGDLDDVPFVEGYEVNANGAKVNIKGPWGGIRAGLAVGFRF